MAKRILKHILKNWNEYEVWNHKTYTVTEDFTTVTTEATLWTNPYDTSYWYTNITIAEDSWIKWKEWAVYSFVVNTEMVVASAKRNVRVRIWSSWSWIPVMDWAGTILNWNEFMKKSGVLLFVYKTTYQSTGALHMDTTISWKQATLVSGTNIKTINNESLLGSWNITIQSWTTYTAGENIKISSNVISANNVFIITEDDVTVSTTQEYWVEPYNTSYYYTNIDISANAGIEWREWALYTFVVDTEMVVASANRNVRVKIWTWAYIPVMWSSAILAWSSYFVKTQTRCFQYSTKYQSWWALHLITDSNTTYSAMSVSEWKTGTATTSRTVRADYLKQITEYHIQQNSILKTNTWTQTVNSTTASQTTPLGVKSANTNSAYISFSNANGWKWSYWVDNSWNPMYYNWTGYQLAYKSDVDWKQATLVSWTNIKTINWNSVLWSGDLTVGTDYSRQTKTISSGSVEIWLRTIVEPTSNFTLTAPATLKDWEEYVIRCINTTSYTITLWTWITNPRSVNLSTSQYATDQFVFLAIGGQLELQPISASGTRS